MTGLNNATISALQLNISHTNRYDDHKTLETAYGFAGSVIAGVGVVLDIISAIVWSRPEMRSTHARLLVSLSVYDVGFLAVAMSFDTLDSVYRMATGSNDWLLMRFRFYSIDLGLRSFFYFGLVNTTLIITLNRYLAVAFPHSWLVICTRFRVKIIIFFVGVATCLQSVPGLVLLNEPRDSSNIFQNNSESLYSIAKENLKSSSIFEGYVVMLYIQTVTLALLNTSIVTVLIRQRSRNASLSAPRHVRRHNRHERRLTLQVLVISLFSLINAVLFNFMYYFRNHEGCFWMNYCSIETSVLIYTTKLGFLTNSAINFIFYCYFGKKFRQCFLKMFWSKSEDHRR